MPKLDTTIALEDETGQLYETKYLAQKAGLSAGWRGFSIAHNLLEMDVLIFHLVQPSKFRVIYSFNTMCVKRTKINPFFRYIYALLCILILI